MFLLSQTAGKFKSFNFSQDSRNNKTMESCKRMVPCCRRCQFITDITVPNSIDQIQQTQERTNEFRTDPPQLRIWSVSTNAHGRSHQWIPFFKKRRNLIKAKLLGEGWRNREQRGESTNSTKIYYIHSRFGQTRQTHVTK